MSQILVADDEPALLNILKKHLSKKGYSVLTAGNGLEVLTLLESKEVQLIILDLNMPRMGGLNLLRKIRQLKGAPQLPVVILTAYVSPSSAREAMQLGAIEYLTKPFDLVQLTSVVREALKAKEKSDRLLQRRLIYVPILHTVSDMGTLAGSMRETYVKKFGEKKWVEHVEAIDRMWEGIKERIQQLNLPYQGVRIYQDGIPLCGKEREIVEDLAKRQSPNHLLLRWLMHQGATLVGTEDPALLVREYNHYKKITSAKNHLERERLIHRFEGEEAVLLRKRDQYIRKRILATLKPGETGILFMGLLHRVDELMPPEIVKINYLIHRLPFRRSFEMEMVA
jgi:CheY-like chemotaxis protein